jgi:hypothetical protein
MSSRGDGFRTELIEYVKSVTDLAEEDILRSDVKESEKQNIRESVDSLRISVEYLLGILQAHDALQMGLEWREPYNPSGHAHVLSALGAMRRIAYLTTLNPIASRLEKEVKNGRAARARSTQAPGLDVKNKLARAIIEPVLKKHPDWPDKRIADSISEELNTALKRSNLRKLGPSAIRDRVKKLRESCSST